MAVDPLVSNPMISSIFGGGPGVPTLDELQRRRAIAVALASRQRPYPKNIGEGITSIGEGLGEYMNQQRLLQGEQAYRNRDLGVIGANPLPGTPPAAKPAPASPPAVAPRADVTGASPDVAAYADPEATGTPTSGRDMIALALRSAAQGVPPANPTDTEAGSPPVTSQDSPSPDAVRPEMQPYLNALAGGETPNSRDPYSALGTVTNTGDRAYGKYQIMGKNIPQWTQAALGQPLTPQQFLSDPNAQDLTAQHRFGNYVDKYGPQGAARAWYAGEGGMNNLGATDINGKINVGQYGQQFLNRLNGGGGAPTRVASLDPTMAYAAGAPAEAADNPPIPTDIAVAPTRLAGAVPTPAPAVPPSPPAAASTAVPTVPSPSDPRMREDFKPPPGAGPIHPDNLPPLVQPSPPVKDEALSPLELQGKAIQRQAIDSPLVQAHGQQFIDLGKSGREAAYQRDVTQYNQDIALYNQLSAQRAQYREQYPKLLQDYNNTYTAEQQRLADRSAFPAGRQQAIDLAKESYQNVKNIPASEMAISNVRQLMDNDPKMFTGKGAELKTDVAKMAGLFGYSVNPRATATETFNKMLTPIISQLRSAIVGAGSQSDKEFATLQNAAAANVTLEPGTIRNVLGAIQRLNLMAATQHHETLQTNSGNDPGMQQLLYGNYRVRSIPDMVPQNLVDSLRKNIDAAGGDPAKIAAEKKEFDTDNFYPGLSNIILQRRK